MSFPGDLLDLAQHLAELHNENPQQASLRRAVSTAYYALFHLLISEATANWAREELRGKLGRCFDHGPMKNASEATVAQIKRDLKANALEPKEETTATHLNTVARAFIQAQERRNEADYNIDKHWTPVEVATHIASVTEASKPGTRYATRSQPRRIWSR